MEKRRDFSNS